MGYEIDRFVNLSPAIAYTFKCSICLDIYEVPLELPCGHIFCTECIRNCFCSGTTCECPECRRQTEPREVKPPNRKLVCLLHSLNIKCEFASVGCNAVVNLENLITHTRECEFNTSRRLTAPLEEINYETLSDLLGDFSSLMERSERLERVNALLADLTGMLGEFEEDASSVGESEGRGRDNELLMPNTGSYESFFFNCLTYFLSFLLIIVFMYLIAAPVAAIVISSLKFHSCTEMPTLPHALLALGISLFLSFFLEQIRQAFYEEKFCVGLKFIQCFALGSLIYLSFMVYSNLNYTKCDRMLMEFSFWFVTALLSIICFTFIFATLYSIYDNLTTIWSQWERSYVLFVFVYAAIPIPGIIISISAIAMGSIFSNSCPAIPSLTTKVIVFGALSLVCYLIMLLSLKFKSNVIFWLLVLSMIVSFICVAVSVHDNFLLKFMSPDSIYNINCNETIYIYSLAIVCVNYFIIGLTILLWLIYGGICSFLFCR